MIRRFAVVAALVAVMFAAPIGCTPPRSDRDRVPDSGAPVVWVTPSPIPAPGPCGGVR